MKVDIEERPSQIMNISVRTKSYWDLMDKYSTLTRLLRITAICRRFAMCLKRIPQKSLAVPLNPEELNTSRLFWAKVVQKTWFDYEIRIISNREVLPRSNPLVNLIPFIDKEGLLRVGGHLHHAKIDSESKHPIILPRKSPLTTLFIDDAHKRTLHGGTQLTLSYLRRSCWIIGGRAAVRSRILKCVRCARHRGIRAQQLMGQLPPSRVTPARPF